MKLTHLNANSLGVLPLNYGEFMFSFGGNLLNLLLKMF